MNTFIEAQAYGSVRPRELSDWMISHGIATVTTRECAHLLGIPIGEVSQRLVRARSRRQLVALARGLWAAVPPEYRSLGAPEPLGYIDDLMAFYQTGYCVGWLSAAELYGASHQAPQVFQVAAVRGIRNRKVGQSSLEFHTRSWVNGAKLVRISRSTGSVVAPTTGATMLMVASDLLLCGGLDNAATVIAELSEEHPGYLSDVMGHVELFPASAACRLGWILENVSGEPVLDGLAAWCQTAGEVTMLSPQGPRSGKRDTRWNVLVNREVYPDL